MELVQKSISLSWNQAWESEEDSRVILMRLESRLLQEGKYDN